jgi:regulatory protein
MEEGISPEGARKKALFYLTRKEHSAREVRDYLRRKGYDEETSSRVTESLRTSGLVDDGRLAEMILRSAPGRGWGPSRTRQELLRRGIEREMASEAVQRLYPEDDFAVALSCGRKKWSSTRGDDRLRESRLAGYLSRRGFSTNTVIRVLSELKSEAPEDIKLP